VTSQDEIGDLSQAFNRMVDQLRENERIRETFGRYIDPRIIRGLIDQPDLDGQRRVMTVLFCDMKGFTRLSEDVTPQGLVKLMNRYLTTMSEPIRENRGIIDKYIGDAIMALFERADDAIGTGLAMMDTLAAYNAERRAADAAPIGIGIGINSGSLMLGTIGEADRMDGTVISDAVNLASRIESLTKTYGIGLLISQDTYEQLSDPTAWDIRPIDVVVVKGKTRPVVLYEVFERNEPAERDRKRGSRDLLMSGIAALAKHDLAAARLLFEQCLAQHPGDPAATSLLQRCA